jgi:Xaa-Pro aminopeptidase
MSFVAGFLLLDNEDTMFKTDTNIPADEIERRIVNFQARLCDSQIDGALIVQNSDLYYLSGTIQQCHLYVPAQGKPLLMARKSFERARAESPIAEVMPLSSSKKIPSILSQQGLPRPVKLGMELDVLPFNLYQMYADIFYDSKILDVSPTIRMQRAIKSAYEISIMTAAAQRSDRVAAHVAEVIQIGQTELELAGQVEAFARKLGHQGTIRMRMWGSELFYGHLLAGSSGAVPSFLASPTGGRAASPAVAQGAGYTRLAAKEPILLDYAFAYNGYISDQTRIFSLGRLPSELRTAHEAMLSLQAAVKQMARPGVAAGEIYELCVQQAAEAGYGDYFMGHGDQRIRFVGHGVGLELDEYPVLAEGQKMPLQAGMTIALEPKLIFPGKGVVGIENTHVVTDEGLQQLGQYPDTITALPL